MPEEAERRAIRTAALSEYARWRRESVGNARAGGGMAGEPDLTSVIAIERVPDNLDALAIDERVLGPDPPLTPAAPSTTWQTCSGPRVS